MRSHVTSAREHLLAVAGLVWRLFVPMALCSTGAILLSPWGMRAFFPGLSWPTDALWVATAYLGAWFLLPRIRFRVLTQRAAAWWAAVVLAAGAVVAVAVGIGGSKWCATTAEGEQLVACSLNVAWLSLWWGLPIGAAICVLWCGHPPSADSGSELPASKGTSEI